VGEDLKDRNLFVVLQREWSSGFQFGRLGASDIFVTEGGYGV
jgi:hypothetical protein